VVSEAFLAWLVSLSCTELAAFLFYFSIFTIKKIKKNVGGLVDSVKQTPRETQTGWER
jgi:hypothetical protein